MRRRFIECGFILIVCATALFSQTHSYYIPQVIDGPVKQVVLKTTIVISNPGPSSASLSLSLTKDDGAALPLTFHGLAENSHFVISLKPGATHTLKTNGQGSAVAGAAQITSNVPVNVYGIVSAFAPTGTLLSASGLPSSSASRAYTLPVERTGSTDTGVAIFNPGAEAAALTFTLQNASGSAVSSFTQDLPAGGHLSKSEAILFPSEKSFQGTMTITSTVPVAAWILRQNAASPAYTLLQPARNSSLRLKFYVPELAVGASASGQTVTTFEFANLSKTTAVVKLSFTEPSGSPWNLSVSHAKAKAAYQFNLPPLGSAFWQIEAPTSSTPQTLGAAAITATEPIALNAVSTTSDDHGNFLAETGLAEDSPQTAFSIPYDATSTAAGVAFYNAGAQPATLTLSLLDENGNTLAKTSKALNSFGSLSTTLTSLFPKEKLSAGSILVSTGGAGSAISGAAMAQQQTGLTISSLPAAASPSPPVDPVTIVSTLDSSRQVSAAISSAGGSLSLTDAQGNQFSLTIPPSALLSPTTITMTPVSAATGLPNAKLIAAVQLAPDGLALYAPATLTVTPAAPVTSPVPLGWHTNGPGFYLNPVELGDTFTMRLMHFSVAGVSVSDNVTASLYQIVNIWDLETSAISYFLNRIRQEQLLGCEPNDPSCTTVDQSMVNDKVADLYADGLIPLMQLALETGDNDLLRCAMVRAIEFQKIWLLTGESSAGSATFVDGVEISSGVDTPFIQSANQTIGQFISNATNQYIQNIVKQCLQSGDPFTGLEILGAMRQLALTGGDPSGLAAAVNACPATLELDFGSFLAGQISVTNAVEQGSFSFSGTLSAKANLSVTIPESSASSAQKPDSDFEVNVGISGSGPEAFSNVSASGSLTVSDGTNSTTCGLTLAGVNPATFSVLEGSGDQASQIQFRLQSQYNQRLVSLGGTALCAFCPVYQKTPIAVQLLVDPGMPSESYTTCAGTSANANSWLALWLINHGAGADNGFITSWQLPGPTGVFAEKDISQPIGPPAVNGNEITTFKLINPPIAMQ